MRGAHGSTAHHDSILVVLSVPKEGLKCNEADAVPVQTGISVFQQSLEE
ncbi:MAG TPA: hypothetical protein VMT12_02410 [Syntrophales bacterium]|nr:hypothetical protein [Syntrophales bacterium]